MIRNNNEDFPTMKRESATDDDTPLHEFPSFCPPVSLMQEDENNDNKIPPLCPFPRMKKTQNRGLSMPTMMSGHQNGNNNSFNSFKFSKEIDDQPPPSPSSALPKLITLNSSSPRGADCLSVPSSGRKTMLMPTIPKASPLKPVCLQTIVPRRRNASVLGKITNVCTPIQ